MKLKKLAIIGFTALSLLVPAALLAADPATPSTGGGFAEAQQKIVNAGKVAYGTGAADASLESIIGNIIQTVLGLIGVLFMGLAIYGGYLWMMARGNEQQVDKAKETIKSAVIGAVIVLAAWAITNFVFTNIVGSVTGVTQGTLK